MNAAPTCESQNFTNTHSFPAPFSLEGHAGQHVPKRTPEQPQQYPF